MFKKLGLCCEFRAPHLYHRSSLHHWGPLASQPKEKSNCNVSALSLSPSMIQEKPPVLYLRPISGGHRSHGTQAGQDSQPHNSRAPGPLPYPETAGS